MKQVLFICTGNTCRSPMAEALFNSRAQALGLPWRAASAGLAAAEGEALSAGAYRALQSRGAELPGHRARQTNPAMVAAADLVFCMTDSQVAAFRRLYPGVAVARLGASDITDPYGAPQETYERAAAQIGRSLDELLQKLLQA